jgi:MFS family permease
VRLTITISALSNSGFFIPVAVAFFMSLGMRQASIMLLQSTFQATAAIMEVPLGRLADRWSRRGCLIIGGLTLAFGFAVYSLAQQSWQLYIVEALLGVGVSSISGADRALVKDNVGAGKYQEQYETPAMTWSSIVGCVTNVMGCFIALHSLRLTAAAEVIPALIMTILAIRTVELRRRMPPGEPDSHRKGDSTPGRSAHPYRRIWANRPLVWLNIYYAIMSASTFSMVWLAQPYFKAMGIPVVWTGLAWGTQMAIQAYLSKQGGRYERWVSRQRWLGRNVLASFVALVTVSYLVLAAGEPLGWIGLAGLPGLILVRAVFTPIVSGRINELLPTDINATGNSIRSLIYRVTTIVLSPIIGLVCDHGGLGSAMLASGAIYGGLGALALWRLHAALRFAPIGGRLI